MVKLVLDVLGIQRLYQVNVKNFKIATPDYHYKLHHYLGVFVYINLYMYTFYYI